MGWDVHKETVAAVAGAFANWRYPLCSLSPACGTLPVNWSRTGCMRRSWGDRPGPARTVYVLVLAATLVPGSQRSPDNGEEVGNALPYRIKTLARYTGKSAPVVVAITQCDERGGVEREIDGWSCRWK